MKIIYYILCLVLLQSCYFLGPSAKKRFRKIQKVSPIDVAIVPGLPLHEGKCDTLLKSRLLWSEFLYKKGYVKNIIYSGNAVYTPWVESISMALFADKLGIPSEHIFVDTLAEHSTENLYYGYMLAKQKGFKSVAIATDPVQCAMLHRFAKKKFDQEIHFIPVIYDSIRHKIGIPLEIDTSLSKKKNFISIKERQDYKERLKGTRGRRVKNKR